jgi:putative selenate reductase
MYFHRLNKVILSGNFHPLPLPDLLQLTLSELRQNRFMGIPGSLFFRPQPSGMLSMTRYGRLLETPIGVAAGPHTQLALNIVAAWLCGARYIELKTIQTLDELDVSKPCIDMQDEGYNCEWSQELKVRESFAEYLHAWILIHILRKELGFPATGGELFNMSVGYNLEGILKDNVQWFFSRMLDCSAELSVAKELIRHIYPAIDSVNIPAMISDHVTLSTMHGCPPEEIEKIGLYLINEKNLHTTVKLNPTLLGPVELRGLLNTRLGFTTEVPDLAFEHDLKYPDALKILDSLTKASEAMGLQFGIKLTNTLESKNHKDVFGASEPMMYMSGRALHPISIRLAGKLQHDFDGKLDISFSAGVDCFNVAEVLACGMKPVTVCSDLLKPGGYGRLHQYIQNLETAFSLHRADSLDTLILHVAGNENLVSHAALHNLNSYADCVADNPAYHKNSFSDPSIKTTRPLGWFDCIHAPCTDTCPANQDIPEYMYHTASGDLPSAFRTIFRTNPFPSVTGMVCDHLCQLKCTRINYDEPLQIREIKRYVAEAASSAASSPASNGNRTAIIGAGPAGLSCAWFLRQAGFEVDVFEQKEIAGGMVAAAIPSFRLTSQAIEKDIQRILASGIRLHDNHKIDQNRFKELSHNYDAMFLAAGAQESVKLSIDGVDAEGVLDPLEFLYDVRKNRAALKGNRIVIIGGGNTAMDAARTAYRLAGPDGDVTVVYRRTIHEMPADKGEIEAVLNEGIRVVELANPIRVNAAGGKVTGLLCTRNTLSGKAKDGRPVPVAIPQSEFVIDCDTIIPAIGQVLAIDFLAGEQLETAPGSYQTKVTKLFIGGDALRGASTAINAIGDGRKAAMEIISGISPFSQDHSLTADAGVRDINKADLIHRKSVREYGRHPAETALNDRRNFNLVIDSLHPEDAAVEASRCLQCDIICNVCVSVCPNLANFGYSVKPVRYNLKKAVMQEDGTIVFEEDKIFITGQQYQVLNIRDFCNECGNCTTFCPTGGRPFADKPGLCLSVESLNKEETGFFLNRNSGRQVLIYKEKDSIRTLSLADGRYVYETELVRAVIDPETFDLLDVKFLVPCVKEAHFDIAAEMSVVMRGAGEVTGDG